MIKRLIPGSIPELAMCSTTGRCIHGKTLYDSFPLEPIPLPVVVVQPDERLAESKVSCVGVVTHAECLVHTNNRPLVNRQNIRFGKQQCNLLHIHYI